MKLNPSIIILLAVLTTTMVASARKLESISVNR